MSKLAKALRAQGALLRDQRDGHETRDTETRCPHGTIQPHRCRDCEHEMDRARQFDRRSKYAIYLGNVDRRRAGVLDRRNVNAQ